jgi:hypothetical protein
MLRIGRMTAGRIARIGAGLALAAGALAALPAVPASASTSVMAEWNVGTASNPDDIPVTLPCGNPGTFTYGGQALQVYNPCPDRVWLHYDDNSNGQIYTFCVNPGGGLAYAFSYPFTDIQVTTNASQCDSDGGFTIVWLESGLLPAPSPLSCTMSPVPHTFSEHWVMGITLDSCNYRIWLHQTDSGGGQSLCLDPGQVTPSYPTPVYWQVQETNNQTPCHAGGPQYPY